MDSFSKLLSKCFGRRNTEDKCINTELSLPTENLKIKYALKKELKVRLEDIKEEVGVEEELHDE